MNLEEMKAEYESAKEDYKLCKSKTARIGINDACYELNKKIEAEQNRVDKQLKKFDGIDYLIPEVFNWYDSRDNYTMKVEGNVLYVLETSGELEKDGSYHWYSYAWIPQTDTKYAKLCVKTLGNDRFGDRYSLSVRYFKHPADPYSYMEKYIDYNNRTYKPYLEYILKELGLTEKMIGYRPRR